MKVGASPTARGLLYLACALLVLARVSGTHLHLCFDGSEPPASLHLIEDGDADFHFGANGPHEDLDISAVGDLLLKQDTVGGNLLPMLVAVAVVLGLARLVSSGVWYSGRTVPVPASTFELRPPPRGPPA